MVRDTKFLKLLRLFGHIEGASTLVLFFIAMPLKYMYGMPIAVTICGSVHGLLFMTLVVLFLVGRDRVPLSAGLVAAGIMGAIIPFGPFVVDVWLRRLSTASKQATSETATA